jgi:hypothetical protein
VEGEGGLHSRLMLLIVMTKWVSGATGGVCFHSG